MGKFSHVDWHHLFMANTHSDTYLDVCNSAQHSSAHAMNHRFWFRKTKSK